ncbi:LysR family transcriptional regulator, positive regulator for ilvC [Thalassotalea agarivorans]|uniref:LysR family transcriptional regulator, positive regulator for ilvC n=2 Tax=Thalassotalea agarivorans TaxID=349064 RepID=A0A1I0E500_THASX|nr:LysR family transcriptional regulator, positive regulator for ilvC [Thalassotalea agarivorans]
MQMFSHLAQHLHFGKTAEHFHLSPSTLSRAITRMEEELGVTLFARDNRSVALTQAGKTFEQFCLTQIEQWQLFQHGLNQQQARLTGKLHIYCSVTAAYSHLPSLLEKFRAQHPLVEIVLTTGDASDAIEQVAHQGADIAIAAKPDTIGNKLQFLPIAKIPMTIIAPKIACHVHQLVNNQPIDWREIPFILPEHGPARKRFESWYRHKQLGKPTIYATVSGHEALVSMVALGCGVGIAPVVVVENSPVKDKVFEISDNNAIAPFELGLVHLRQQKDQPLINAFVEALR